MKKKRLFFDMDNVLVDFKSGLDKVDESIKAQYRAKTPDEKDRLDEVPGLFSLMKPMKGAVEAVRELAKVYDVFILSTAPWNNPSAWSDKVEWVKKYFDSEDNDPQKNPFYKRMVITHRKDLCEGDYLIDDRGKNGTSEFKGEWIQFGSGRFPNWDSVKTYLLSKESVKLQKPKQWLEGLLPNRDRYSWLILLLLVFGEAFVLWGLRSKEWLYSGPGVFVAIAIGFILAYMGRKANHSFSIKSVILTKLLANAISPQRLGTIYLLLFVIHIGWLTNAAMSLFTPTQDLCDVVIAMGTCIAGMIALIFFFPIGTVQKNKGLSKVFVSGMSFISVPKEGYDKLNLIPLVRILQLMEKDDKPCQLIILKTNALKEYDKKNATAFDLQTETFCKVMQLIMPDEIQESQISKGEESLFDFCKAAEQLKNSKDVNEQVCLLIRAVAAREFPDRPWLNSLLSIKFTKESCDYNKDFEGCFSELEKEVSPKDDENHQLYFNCTPGTSTVGSVMTLFSIDGDRELYFYSQEEMKPNMTEAEKIAFRSTLMRRVDKNKIPLYNLLSQALERFEKRM